MDTVFRVKLVAPEPVDVPHTGRKKLPRQDKGWNELIQVAPIVPSL